MLILNDTINADVNCHLLLFALLITPDWGMGSERFL